jgi:hypothetical protein
MNSGNVPEDSHLRGYGNRRELVALPEGPHGELKGLRALKQVERSRLPIHAFDNHPGVVELAEDLAGPMKVREGRLGLRELHLRAAKVVAQLALASWVVHALEQGTGMLGDAPAKKKETGFPVL